MTVRFQARPQGASDRRDYYLPRNQGETGARTERYADGLLVDFAADGRPIGIEITSPAKFQLHTLNDVLSQIGQGPIRPEVVVPLAAA